MKGKDMNYAQREASIRNFMLKRLSAIPSIMHSLSCLPWISMETLEHVKAMCVHADRVVCSLKRDYEKHKENNYGRIKETS